MNTVVMLRGGPGSGKSFAAKQLCQLYNNNVAVCSADNYFIHPDGVYVFDHTKLKQAHLQCKRKFIESLLIEVPLIVLDNTNILYSEMKFYFEFANVCGYKIELLESQSPWRRDAAECFARNTHGVPLSVIESMIERFHTNEEVQKFALENLGISVNIYKSEGF